MRDAVCDKSRHLADRRSVLRLLFGAVVFRRFGTLAKELYAHGIVQTDLRMPTAQCGPTHERVAALGALLDEADRSVADRLYDFVHREAARLGLDARR